MGISGRSIEKDYPLEKMIDIVMESRGVVKAMVTKTGYGFNAIYNYLDTYPELQEARKKAGLRLLDTGIETGQEIMDKLMLLVEEDPGQAFKAAQFLLKHTKTSPFYEDKDSSDEESLKRFGSWIGQVTKYADAKVEKSIEEGGATEEMKGLKHNEAMKTEEGRR